MFIGHYAVAFAAKKAAPKVSLGTLFLAVQFLDLLWPILVLLGLEHFRIDPGNTAFTPLDFYDYPISHSLLTALVWSIGLAGVYNILRGYPRGSLVVGAGVFSHWILDYITHGPDMPISPWMETTVGLGLWNSIPATILVEGGLFVVGVVLYLRSTEAMDRKGKWALWSLIAFFVLVWIANMAGPPPPNEMAVAYSALLLWLMVPWGYWIDRHRRSATVD